jgi:hypothetical protein
MQLRPVLLREGEVGEHVVLGFVHEAAELDFPGDSGGLF